jgi:uncharacterized protein YggE
MNDRRSAAQLLPREEFIMKCEKRVLLIALLLTVLSPAAALAQFGRDVSDLMAGGRPTVAATGTVAVQQKPTRMRMHMQLFAKAKTLEAALAKLKERREAATLQLESLKADKKSIVFDGPALSAAEAGQKRQLEAMVMQQLRARGKKPKGIQVPQTVTVTSTLTAEWPLEAKSQEQLLVLVQGIEEKIKGADISGSQEMEKLSPEEEELADEAKQMMGRFGQQEQPLGQPTFLYVAVLSKPDRQKAMAGAFAKASAEAAELAKAAGVGLGPLVGLSGGCNPQRETGEEGYNPYLSGRNFVARMMAQAGGDSDEKQSEAVSANPATLTFSCYVAATFTLAK